MMDQSKKVRDCQHFEACALAYDLGYIDDNDVKTFTRGNNWTRVFHRKRNGESQRFREWTTEDSVKKEMDHRLQEGENVVLLLVCLNKRKVVRARYETKEVRLQLATPPGVAPFWKIIPRKAV